MSQKCCESKCIETQCNAVIALYEWIQTHSYIGSAPLRVSSVVHTVIVGDGKLLLYGSVLRTPHCAQTNGY